MHPGMHKAKKKKKKVERTNWLKVANWSKGGRGGGGHGLVLFLHSPDRPTHTHAGAHTRLVAHSKEYLCMKETQPNAGVGTPQG